MLVCQLLHYCKLETLDMCRPCVFLWCLNVGDCCFPGLPEQIMRPAQKLGRPSVLDLINTAVSCLSTVLHYRTSPSSYLTLPWCHLILPLSLSPSFSLGFIGRARICMSSDAHMLGHFLIVFHIKQPCLMWSCTGTAHVKISGQLGLGRGKADTCLPYKWRSILLESKKNTVKGIVRSKIQHRVIEKICLQNAKK